MVVYYMTVYDDALVYSASVVVPTGPADYHIKDPDPGLAYSFGKRLQSSQPGNKYNHLCAFVERSLGFPHVTKIR